jgi:hypothetical protein
VRGDDGQAIVHGATLRPLRDRVIYTTSFVPVLVLAVAGMWLRRRCAGHDGVLWCVVITFVAVHAIFFPATRYRTPMEFVLLFYAAVAIEALAGRWTRVSSPLPASIA